MCLLCLKFKNFDESLEQRKHVLELAEGLRHCAEERCCKGLSERQFESRVENDAALYCMSHTFSKTFLCQDSDIQGRHSPIQRGTELMTFDIKG